MRQVSEQNFSPYSEGCAQLGSTLEAQLFLTVRISPADRLDRIQRVAGEGGDPLIAQPLFPIMLKFLLIFR